VKRNWLNRFTAVTVIALLAVFGLTKPDEAKALSGSSFDPGLIISDSVFYDFGTMSVDDIQRFLESQVPECKSGTKGMPCLRDYKTDTPEEQADAGKCAYMPAQTKISAAQIIYNISRACGINPRVLLVTLQKEQGLVQASIPSPYMYRAAMGYGCPDSDPGICGKVWTGLFNQLYKAAGQFQWYGDPNGSFTYLRPGRQISIDYNEVKSKNCGRRTFLLKSQATANLYYYTPYTPNDAALNNLRGAGDSCSAYGNRNFWRFYWDWFGSPIGGGFLLKSATSDPYLVVNDVKYPLSDPGMVADLGPLGPLGEISTDYLNSFTTGAPLTRIVKSPLTGGTNYYWFISGGKKYFINNCDQATNLGLDCSTAVQLTQVQLDALPNGPFRPDITGIVKNVPVAPAKTSYYMASATKKFPVDCGKAPLLGFNCNSATVLPQDQLDALQTVQLSPSSLGISPMISTPDGSRVLIQAGVKHEVLDDASLAAEGVGNIAPSPLTVADFSYLPWGAPIAIDGSLFVNRDNNREGVLISGAFYDIDPVTRSEADFTKWFRQSTGTLGKDGLSTIPNTGVVKSLIKDETGQAWFITADGKLKVDATDQWLSSAAPVSTALVNAIPTVSKSITGFDYLKVTGQSTIYLLKDGVARETFNDADRLILGSGMITADPVQITPNDFTFIPQSVMVLPLGLVVKNKNTKVVSIIDGPTRAVTIAASSAKLPLASPRLLTNLQLAGYQDFEQLGPYKVTCAGNIYVVANGLLYEPSPNTAKDLPGKSTPLSAATCASLTTTDQSFGHYVGKKIVDPKTKKTTYVSYKISKGKRFPFKTLGDYKKDNLTDPPLVWVDDSFLANLPLGNQIDLGGGVKPTPTPQPTSKEYTIQPGDSLSSIASRFKTTVAKLMALNNLVNADRIKIGQVLKLP